MALRHDDVSSGHPDPGWQGLNTIPERESKMQLIGVLDSPYVRRVAISLQLLGLKFEHRPLSVFSAFDEFSAINPVVKAPTLVTDDGTMLIDSGLILSYAQALAGLERCLWPRTLPKLAQALAVEGLAMAACEKSVQIVHESRLRPPEKMHEPWLARITAQLLSAFQALESALCDVSRLPDSASIGQAGISTAVAWQFTRQSLPELFDENAFPRLRAYSASAEMLPAFVAAPHSFTAVVATGKQ